MTRAGFEPDTFTNIKRRIEGKLEIFNPGFDFSPDSPDGQLIGIFAYEVALLWSQLNMVYNSYNPKLANGGGLRNLGMLTGIQYGAATRSYVTCETQGVAGTIIKEGSIIADDKGNTFYVTLNTAIPSNIQAIATKAGPIKVDAGTVVNIKTATAGWTGITQTVKGVEGANAQTDQQYRNLRQATVLKNYTSVPSVLQARLVELGVPQANVLNNTSSSATLPDGTPPNTIHVTVGELGTVSRKDIAQTILDANGMGCPTYGAEVEYIKDKQGVEHEVRFSIAAPLPIKVVVDVTYLSDNIGGASEGIIRTLEDQINSLKSGEDVIWSRLFQYITPFAKAQVNTLTIGLKGSSQGTANIPVNANQFAELANADVVLTVDGIPV